MYNRGGNIYDKHNDELSLRKFRLSRSFSCTRVLCARIRYVTSSQLRRKLRAYESIMFPDRYLHENEP